jgi:Domain of unknown function (DUF3841)
MSSNHPQHGPLSESTSSASILSMPDNPTLDAIDQLISASANTLITLWTMQQPGAVQQLHDKGRLTVDPEISLVTHCKPGKRAAYVWMQEQMKKRLFEYSGELPIWALFSHPPRTTRAGDQLLRVDCSVSWTGSKGTPALGHRQAIHRILSPAMMTNDNRRRLNRIAETVGKKCST